LSRLALPHHQHFRAHPPPSSPAALDRITQFYPILATSPAAIQATSRVGSFSSTLVQLSDPSQPVAVQFLSASLAVGFFDLPFSCPTRLRRAHINSSFHETCYLFSTPRFRSRHLYSTHPLWHRHPPSTRKNAHRFITTRNVTPTPRLSPLPKACPS
jgi:hypothetical protein